MGAVLQVKLDEQTHQGLSDIAAQCGLSLEKVAELVLRGFIAGKGKMYVGAWKEGPGIRVLPDWPRFSSLVFRLKTEELK